MCPFFDAESDDDALFVGLIACRTAHAYVGVAVVQIEAANEAEVGFDLVGIVGVVVGEKAEHIALAGFDGAFELGCGKSLVAGKLDLADGKLVAFRDDKNERRASTLVFDGLRIDLHVEIAALPVELDDLIDVVVRDRP